MSTNSGGSHLESTGPNPDLSSVSGGDGDSNTSKTWANVLGRSKAQNIDNNVLEVVLEKDTRGGFNVSDLDCCNLLRRLGLDQRPGVHVVGVQICPNGRGVIFITLRKDLDITRYCRYDVMDVTSTGIRTVLVKPAGQTEVVVTLRGIHPNTGDDAVIEYLEKFGKVVTKKVIYGVFSEGPLKGLRNGDRNYKMELKPSISLGSYHVIDGQRVSVKYPGQQQTCARCLEAAQYCKGRGVARKCEVAGGPRADFNSYILNLWSTIGYSPKKEASKVTVAVEEHEELLSCQDGGTFTPQKFSSEADKFSGVVIKNIPKETDHGEIVEYLVLSGLPEAKKEHITINNSGTVYIRNLENSQCLALIASIHWKKNFGRKLYCNGYVPLTPEKVQGQPLIPSVVEPAGDLIKEPAHQAHIVSNTEAGSSPQNAVFRVPGAEQLPPSPADNPLPLFRQDPAVVIAATASSASPVLQAVLSSTRPAQAIGSTASTTEILPDWSISNTDWSEETNDQFVRRHSLSLRTPPKNSLAADILGNLEGQASRPLNISNRSLMNSIKDIQEVLSDFKSCNSTSESSSSEDTSENLKETAACNSRKKRKKKAKSEYCREEFLKKQDTKLSPQ